LFPNKEGVVVCCVDEALGIRVSLCHREQPLSLTTVMASTERRRRGPRIGVCFGAGPVRFRLMRHRRGLRSVVVLIARWMSRRGLRSQAPLSQACSGCQIGLHLQAAKSETELGRRRASPTVLVAVAGQTQRARRCSGAGWPAGLGLHCCHWYRQSTASTSRNCHVDCIACTRNGSSKGRYPAERLTQDAGRRTRDHHHHRQY